MALYKFFKDTCDMPLPSPSGSLKRELDSAAIVETNKELSKLITSANGNCSPYLKVTPHQKVAIAKCAAEHIEKAHNL